MPHIEGKLCNVIMENNDNKDKNIPIMAHYVDDLNAEYQIEDNIFGPTVKETAINIKTADNTFGPIVKETGPILRLQTTLLTQLC